jgi:microsomal epoxide hydrolase
MIEEYIINIPQFEIDNLNKKLELTRWADEIDDNDNWSDGTNLNFLKELCRYWQNDFDWREQEKILNEIGSFKFQYDGGHIHFLHSKSNNPNAKNLILTHGWPGSIQEFIKVIKYLRDESNEDFNIVCPSLPGFGFSSKPKSRGTDSEAIARIQNSLMMELGYEKYIAQGGDWGAAICNWLGYDHSKSCRAIHVNCLTMRHPKGPQNKSEKEWEKKFIKDQIMEEGYRTIQATKPQTLSYSMIDSPVGVAAWILEKFHSWSDIKNNKVESVYTKDILLTNIMIYLITNTFNSASWIYFGRREEGGRNFPKSFKKINVPTGIAKFPKEMLEWPPKSYLDRIFKIYQFSEMKKGGHFAALEQPDILVKDLRKFLRSLKYNPYSHNGRGGSL